MKTIELRKFLPLVKIDVEQQEVWGVLAEEAVDKSGEIFDYASSVPHFKAWNAAFSKSVPADGIVSVGNLRAMHKTIAAGKFTSMVYDDIAKKVYVGAKVVDQNEWQKCQTGVYTGFSIGGKYLKVWEDGDYMRYTAVPSEGSLVDNPCMYGAEFTAVKALGVAELVKFVGSPATVEKSLYDVCDLASCLSSLNRVRCYLKDEANWEGDNSAVPGKLKDLVVQLSAVLVEAVREEASELTAGEDENGAYKMEKTELAKVEDAVKAQLDAFLAQLTTTMKPVEKTTDPTDLAKAAKEANDAVTKAFDDRLVKMQTALDASTTEVAGLNKAVEALFTSVEKLLNMPAPVKAALNGAAAAVAVTKAAENEGVDVKKAEVLSDVDMIKKIHAGGPVQLSGGNSK